MDWHTDVKLLGMKKTRLEAMKKLLDLAGGRLKAARDAGDKVAAFKEELYINRMTVEITKLNDEVFAMGQKIGINPETGEISGDISQGMLQPG